MSNAKNHHLIPKTYMKSWLTRKEKLLVKYCDEYDIVYEEKRENVGGIKHYYSIMAGMPICNEKDAELIFAEALKYTVSLNGTILPTPLDLNKHFGDFDNWVVTRADGSMVSKKKIKREIEKVKIRDIEENWNIKYENKWEGMVRRIITLVKYARNGPIEAFDKAYLMNFFTALDWRGFTSDVRFERIFHTLTDAFDDSDIPEDERLLPCLTSSKEELRHYLLLQYYRQYLQDTGPIYNNAVDNLSKTNFHFYVADGSARFITSDSPAFLHRRMDGFWEGILPITPEILMVQGKCANQSDMDSYYVSHVNDSEVEKFNQAVSENATEFIILPPE